MQVYICSQCGGRIELDHGPAFNVKYTCRKCGSVGYTEDDKSGPKIQYVRVEMPEPRPGKPSRANGKWVEAEAFFGAEPKCLQASIEDAEVVDLVNLTRDQFTHLLKAGRSWHTRERLLDAACDYLKRAAAGGDYEPTAHEMNEHALKIQAEQEGGDS